MASATAAEDKITIEADIHKRERILEPMYRQAAVHFSDLHDTPERMLEKGTINDIVPWRTARTLLYWRLHRRLLEEEIRSEILLTQPDLDVRQVDAMLGRWFIEDKGTTESYLWDQDESVVNWLLSQKQNENSVVMRNIHCVRHTAVITHVKEALEEHSEVRLDAVLEIVHSLSASERTELQRALAQLESTSGQEHHNNSTAT